MRRIGLVGFAATTCVLVPAALHALDAGPKQVAKLVAPDAHTIHVGAATVEVKVDGSIVAPGTTVHVTFAASSTARQRVALDVLVMEAMGTGDSRVESPPQRLAREHVELVVEPGTPATRELAFALRGKRPLSIGGRDPFGRYAILVMPPRAADKLEHLRQKAKRVYAPMVDQTGDFARYETAYENAGNDAAAELGVPGQTARLDVLTAPADSPVAILGTNTAKVGETFPVVVRVTNRTNKKVDQVEVSLGAKPAMLGDAYKGLAEDKVTITAPAQTAIALAPHEIKEVVFRVTAKASGMLGLFAETHAENYDPAITDVALDAVEIVGETAPVIGRR